MSFEAMVAELIRRLGDDPEREGMLRTPERVEKSLRFLTQGYKLTGAQAVGDALFAECHQNMVLVKDIEMYSLCEHHLLPFVGVAHVGYLPGDRILGLSKLARAVELFAHGPQVQERLTKQVADWLAARLRPRGVGVVIEAEHLCMTLRGVRAVGTRTITSTLLGTLREDPRSRAEFLGLTGVTSP